MKKIINFLSILLLFYSICWASGKKEFQNINGQKQNIPTSISVSVPTLNTSNPYFTGDGGKNISLGIGIPKSQGLNENQSYLPTLVQGVLADSIKKYSAITVIDRVSLDRVIAETLDPTFEDNLDIVQSVLVM